MVSEYFSLLIIVVLAFITPLLFTRIGIPVVVGEILLGLAVGLILYLYNTITGGDLALVGESVEFLATIGFIFLMFLSGLELDFNKMEGTGRKTMFRGTLILMGTMIIAFPLSLLVGESSGVDMDATYMALVLSTSSVGVILTVAREMGISKKAYGQKIVITSLIADMGTMILITLFAIRVQFLQTGDPLFGLIAVLLFLIIFAFFFLIYKLGSWAIWYYPDILKKFFRSDDPHEIGVRASLAIVFVFVAVSAVIESEALAVIGAFLAGAVISLLFQEGAILEKKLYGIGYGFLVPLFFINLGITFNFEAMLDVSALLLIPLLFAIALLAKIIPSLLFAGGTSWKMNIATGLILSSRLSLLIAAGEIGLQLGVIDETLHSVIIVLAILISILVPTLFKYAFRRYKLEGEIS